MARLPFEIYDNKGHSVTGLAYLDEEFVVFEIQVRKWSLYKMPVETVKAEFAVVDNIRLQRGIFNDHVFIVPRRSELLDAIPGTHKGELKLKVSKRYQDEAQQFVAEVLERKRRRAAP